MLMICAFACLRSDFKKKCLHAYRIDQWAKYKLRKQKLSDEFILKIKLKKQL